MSKIIIDECERKADEIGVYVQYLTDKEREESIKFFDEYIAKLKAKEHSKK